MINNTLKFIAVIAAIAVCQDASAQRCGCRLGGFGGFDTSNFEANCGRGINQSQASALWSNYCHESCGLGGSGCNSGCGNGCGLHLRSGRIQHQIGDGCGSDCGSGCGKLLRRSGRSSYLGSDSCGCDQGGFGYPDFCGCGCDSGCGLRSGRLLQHRCGDRCGYFRANVGYTYGNDGMQSCVSGCGSVE